MENIIVFSKVLENIATKINLYSNVGLCVIVAFLAIYVSRWIYKWRNPKCNGILPPGSMGLPFIGETIQLIIPSPSIDLPPFIKNRHQRYGKIFKTNIAGRRVIVTADPEFNHFLLRQQQGKVVEPWSLDTFAEIFDQEDLLSLKYKRDITLSHFGIEALKDKLIPMIYDCVEQTLQTWSNLDSIEVKGAGVEMGVNFAAKQIFSGSLENVPGNISKLFKDLLQGLMSFPINLPGTAHNKCLKAQKKIREMMKDVVKTRLSKNKRNHGDVLDHLIKDMDNQSYITEEFINLLLFSLIYVSSDTTSSTLTLALKLILENPIVLDQLTAEHENILLKRENKNESLTWDEYKSMTYTLQVINEVLRMGNISPGLFRRAVEDIPINGYTIPKGWVILICTSAMHMDSNQYKDPLSFDPSRWKDIQQNTVAKCFMPFGSGMKQCAGAEYSRVFMSIFLHIMVTKYRWAKVKGGKIVRAPIIRFPEGFHFNITRKNENESIL